MRAMKVHLTHPKNNAANCEQSLCGKYFVHVTKNLAEATCKSCLVAYEKQYIVNKNYYQNTIYKTQRDYTT